MKSEFGKGMIAGIPIGLGYLSVSFGFGIMAAGAGLSAFEAFMENTTISDQFYRANQKLADELRNIVVQSRGGYIDTILKNYTSEDDTYDEERFTDYIFDQNDYTLSDGTHVKIPTSYDYVYEGDNNVVYFSDSAFPEPGTQLSPNR